MYHESGLSEAAETNQQSCLYSDPTTAMVRQASPGVPPKAAASLFAVTTQSGFGSPYNALRHILPQPHLLHLEEGGQIMMSPPMAGQGTEKGRLKSTTIRAWHFGGT